MYEKHGLSDELAKDSQMNREFAILSENIKELISTIASLENRLIGVTRASSPCQSSDDSKNPTQALVPLAHLIREKREEVGGAVRMIRDILSRLEL